MIVLLTAYDDPTGGLGGSEYLSLLHGVEAGVPPLVDLEGEKRLHELVLQGIGEGLFVSCHDVSDGGLAVCLAESAMLAGIGAQVLVKPPQIPTGTTSAALLFGEAQGRVVVTLRNEKQWKYLQNLAKERNIRANWIGTVGGENLRIAFGADILTDIPVNILAQVSKNAIPRRMNVHNLTETTA